MSFSDDIVSEFDSTRSAGTWADGLGEGKSVDAGNGGSEPGIAVIEPCPLYVGYELAFAQPPRSLLSPSSSSSTNVNLNARTATSPKETILQRASYVTA